MLYYTAYEWQLVMQKLNDGDVNKCASDDEFLYLFISLKSEFKGACAKESKCMVIIMYNGVIHVFQPSSRINWDGHIIPTTTS